METFKLIHYYLSARGKPIYIKLNLGNLLTFLLKPVL